MKFLLILLLVVVFISGCVEQSKQDTETTPNDVEPEVSSSDATDNGMTDNTNIKSASKDQSLQLTELAKNYYRYDPDAYQKARSEGKAIFLDFHANWCPICRFEYPEIVAAFNELEHDDVIGFQVHYNDDKTEDFDTDIARQFQVPYQHTKVFLDKEGNLIQKTLSELNKETIKMILGEARLA